jgi:hypothetical protein
MDFNSEKKKIYSGIKISLICWAITILCCFYVINRIYHPLYPDIKIYGHANNGTILTIDSCDSYKCDRMIYDTIMSFHADRIAFVRIVRIDWFNEPPTFSYVDILFWFHIVAATFLFVIIMINRRDRFRCC